MRKLLIAVSAIALVGGYSAFWYKEAGNVKHNFEQTLESYNAQAKTLDPNITLVRYDALEVGGYPFAITLTLKKPVVDVPVSALLKRYYPAANNAPSTNWVEEVSNDDIAFSYNVARNRVTVTFTGDMVQKSLINHAQTHSLTQVSAAPTICHVSIPRHQFGTPLALTDVQSMLNLTLSLDCDAKSMTLKDSASGTVLYTSDGASLIASNEPAEDAARKLVFQITGQNNKMLPASDALLNDYRNQFYNTIGTPQNAHITGIPMSEYGEQNIKIDVHYQGPVDPAAFSDPASKFHFDINNFDIKNALMDGTLEAHLASAPEGGNRTGSLVIHSRSEVTDYYDQLLVKQIANAFALTADSTGKTGDQALAAQSVAKLGAPDAVAAALVPNLHGLGTITFDLDASVKGPNQPEEFMKNGALTLSTFNLTTTPYGITSKGKWSGQNGKQSADLVISCVNCDAMISDSGNYALRAETFFDRARPGQLPVVTKELIEGIRQFLHGIAENPDKTGKDMVIHVALKDSGEFTVSGKQIMQVIGLFSSTIAPHMPSAPMGHGPG